jgi:hypothetical protein
MADGKYPGTIPSRPIGACCVRNLPRRAMQREGEANGAALPIPTTTGGLRKEISGSRCRSEQASTQLDRIGEFIAPSLMHRMELVRKTGAE